MPKYITVGHYQRSGENMASAATMAAETLARFILRAEADIDSFMEFYLSLGGFEPHHAWWQEPWNHQSLKTHIPNWPVPVRDITRYRIQVSNVSNAGAGFFANIGVGDVVISAYQSYIEIVPLQAVTYSMTPVLLALGLNPPLVQVDYDVGYYIGVWDDTLYDAGDGLTFRAIRGFWATAYTLAAHIQPDTLPPVPPVLYVNGVVQLSGYTVNAVEGSVTFTSTHAGQAITADYTYQIPDTVQHAALAQTSYLIGQSDLNAMGMSGVDLARNDHQEARRMRSSQKDNLCVAAKVALEPYIAIAIG